MSTTHVKGPEREGQRESIYSPTHVDFVDGLDEKIEGATEMAMDLGSIKTRADSAFELAMSVATTANNAASAATTAQTSAANAKTAAEEAKRMAQEAKDAAASGSEIGQATSDKAGLMRLYDEVGDNDNGTMTQWAIKQAVTKEATHDSKGIVQLTDNVDDEDNKAITPYGVQRKLEDLGNADSAKKGLVYLYDDVNDERDGGITPYGLKQKLRNLEYADGGNYGLVKLFDSTGDSEEGALTQKALTKVINELKEKEANSTELGLVKLYNKTGENTDGTITQEAISKALNKKLDADSGAKKLETPRTLKVNLASTDDETFDGSANKNIGVFNVLKETNGGTGQSDLTKVLVGMATKLEVQSTPDDFNIDAVSATGLYSFNPDTATGSLPKITFTGSTHGRFILLHLPPAGTMYGFQMITGPASNEIYVRACGGPLSGVSGVFVTLRTWHKLTKEQVDFNS